MDDLSTFAEKLMSEKGVENYNLTLEGLVKKGENYLGEVLFFNILPKNGDKPLHFVRKKAKFVNNTEERECIRKVYQRESYMYKFVFPALKDFTNRQRIKSTLFFSPKVYSIHEEENQEMLIFENMKYSGYQLLDKKLPMDKDRVSLVLETYAKFHSLSFAMSELEPETFKDLTENMTDVWGKFKLILDASNYFGALLKDVVSKHDEDNNSNLMLKYKPIIDDIENVVYVEVDECDRLVICHGDSWSNNMLFKDNEEKAPQSVCLIDFQMSSMSTPALDLSHYLLSTGDKEVLYNIEEYLKLYHDFLSDSLKLFKIDVDKVFSYEKLMKHWRKYGKTGLVIAVSNIQMSLAELEEIPDELNSIIHTNTSEMRNADLFNKRIGDLLISFAEKFL
ncbi:uncharacterized protein LOC123676093 [Harmonia axyridis]|uniref:uncharacterized protein LOC123676093 n=1 Tax=Harmonia axyridis TaxID=115357 RepID=UPI001E277E83|nr:uncharacterized protein LOC123676093 [Harmonia axyridis]